MTTHSASMLNSEIASISHVTMSDGWSAIQTAALPRSVAAVAADLGNRASDLVQSNFVIWVEGPSDRIYISHWLNSFSPDLIEGAHYSVMFYGGALLNHLTADDQEITDFINLNRINRNFALIIDSDRKGPADQLTRTKQRVISECDEAGSYLWVTDGYTIENYIPKSELQLALDTCYPLKTYRLSGDRWKSPLGKAFAGVKSLPSKVTIARSVTSTGTKVKWLYGLEGRIDELVSKIRAANDLNR